MRKSQTRTGARRALRAGITTAATAAVVVGATALPAQAAAVALTMNVTSGANDAGTITGSSATPWLIGYNTPAAYFSQATCPLTWTSLKFSTNTLPSSAGTGIVAPGATKKVSNSKVAVTLPTPQAGTTGVQIDLTDYSATGGTRYNLCVYGAAVADSPLLGTGAYTAMAPARVTAITPAAGPAAGGTTVTVTGSNLPTTAGSITATIGGIPLTVRPGTDTYFTATTPSAAPQSNATLVVSTSAGTQRLANAFSFVNATNIVPNTAPSSQNTVDVDVTGSGFLGFDFTAPTLLKSHVYLVSGKYNPGSGSTPGTGAKTNGPTSECSNVLVIDDKEIICTLQLSAAYAASASATGYTTTTDADANYQTASAYSPLGAATISGTNTITLTSGTFSASMVGLSVTATNGTTGVLGSNKFITAVNGAAATINSTSGVTNGDVTAVTVGGAARTTGNLTTVLGSTAVTAGTVQFYSADVGRRIFDGGTNFEPGTVITAVGADGQSATLSKAAIGASSSATPSIQRGVAVPDGSYNLTVVSNGAKGIADATTYTQSVVSSAATFTVSDF
ncbi:IPT/TIG domain-containing protein [Actinoplanes oblitus]|uniref:IPT/TIG domain-containing protein n=1 Tax=Actinoplanes oblitus TaxID=3040509 RepID=A0ABY8WD14_9ACTN|nr:IPT/TIG domain-containing protein [Actinoplanes oblitus]WIM94938.1 IPT/TIG domain-containing protein [Actinoplanes oblitus]